MSRDLLSDLQMDGREFGGRPGERYAPYNFSERLSFNGGSIMVWGGISWEARTESVFIETGTLTAHRYIEKVLQDHVVGFAQFAGDGFLFNARQCSPTYCSNCNRLSLFRFNCLLRSLTDVSAPRSLNL
jgi:hypothetical protein